MGFLINPFRFGLPLPVPVLASFSIAKTAGNEFSLDVPKPSGLAEGDLLLLAMALDRGGDGGVTSITHPGSMTTVEDDDAAGGYVQGTVLGRIATASEPANYSFSWTTGDGLVGQEAVIAALRISGAAATFGNAVHQSAIATVGGSGSATPTSPGLTTTKSNCLILRFLFGDSDTNFTEDNGYNPSETTEQWARRSSTTAGFGPAQNHLATEEKAAAGAVSSKTFSIVAADQCVGITVAVSPS